MGKFFRFGAMNFSDIMSSYGHHRQYPPPRRPNNTAASRTHQQPRSVNNHNNITQIPRSVCCTIDQNNQLLKVDYVHNPFYTQRYFIVPPTGLNPQDIRHYHNDDTKTNRTYTVGVSVPYDREFGGKRP